VARVGDRRSSLWLSIYRARRNGHRSSPLQQRRYTRRVCADRKPSQSCCRPAPLSKPATPERPLFSRRKPPLHPPACQFCRRSHPRELQKAIQHPETRSGSVSLTAISAKRRCRAAHKSDLATNRLNNFRIPDHTSTIPPTTFREEFRNTILSLISCLPRRPETEIETALNCLLRDRNCGNRIHSGVSLQTIGYKKDIKSRRPECQMVLRLLDLSKTWITAVLNFAQSPSH